LFIGIRRLETDAGGDLSCNVAHVRPELGVGDFGRDDLPADGHNKQESGKTEEKL
jgi:hypothetical protein